MRLKSSTMKCLTEKRHEPAKKGGKKGPQREDSHRKRWESFLTEMNIERSRH